MTRAQSKTERMMELKELVMTLKLSIAAGEDAGKGHGRLAQLGREPLHQELGCLEEVSGLLVG